MPLVVVGRAEDRQNELAAVHYRTRDLYVLAYAVDTGRSQSRLADQLYRRKPLDDA